MKLKTAIRLGSASSVEPNEVDIRNIRKDVLRYAQSHPVIHPMMNRAQRKKYIEAQKLARS